MFPEMFYIFRAIKFIVLELICEACQHKYFFLWIKTCFLPTLTPQTEHEAARDVVQFVVRLPRSHRSVALLEHPAWRHISRKKDEASSNQWHVTLFAAAPLCGCSSHSESLVSDV